MLEIIRKKIKHFLNSEKLFVTLTALASGGYPLLHYYNSNFLMVNSWSQLLWFMSIFIISPTIIFNLALFVTKHISILRNFKTQVLTGLNLMFFFSLMLYVTYGLDKTHLLIIGLISFVLLFLLYKHYKKLVLLQLLMAFFTMVVFLPKLFKTLTYSDDWMELPDTIDQVMFKEKPNIYFIQPDGYTNFSEIVQEPYNYNNSEFRSFLEANDFKIYENTRSNYFSTLTSNASMFAMKHHYYLNSRGADETQYDYRKGLAGNNNAVNILKNNGYKTFLLLDYPYIIINRPKKVMDVINYDYTKMSYIGNAWKRKYPKDTLDLFIAENKTTPKFFFIEKILPTHIENSKSKSLGVDGEREAYFERLEKSNQWLKEIIEKITNQDQDAIIVLVSDHGGYVGLESAEDLYAKIDDTKLKQSIFSSLLAIRWSNNDIPEFEDTLKSNVNLFRVLFAHLSENDAYLQHLEEDKSYITLKDGAPKGVYEYIDSSGQTTFQKMDN